jgi:hypothetical protein
MNQQEGKELVVGGLFTALALVVPVLFHIVGVGEIFLPMFLPIAILGFLVSWRVAAAAGALSPILSALITGMPPLFPPMAVLMSIEGAVLAGAVSLLYRKARLPWYVALAIGDLGERAISGVGLYVLAEWMGLEGVTFSAVGVLIGMPGVALQFAFVPLFFGFFKARYGFLPGRELVAE